MTYRVLSTLERVDGLGFHWPGETLEESDLHPTSIPVLIERGIIAPITPEE